MLHIDGASSQGGGSWQPAPCAPSVLPLPRCRRSARSLLPETRADELTDVTNNRYLIGVTCQRRSVLQSCCIFGSPDLRGRSPQNTRAGSERTYAHKRAGSAGARACLPVLLGGVIPPAQPVWAGDKVTQPTNPAETHFCLGYVFGSPQMSFPPCLYLMPFAGFHQL